MTSTASATSTASPDSSASTPARARRAGRGGRAPGRGARLLHPVELRPPSRIDWRPGSPRSRPPTKSRLFHLRRVGGGRVGAEARPQLPPDSGNGQRQGDRPRGRVSRHFPRRSLGDRNHRAAIAVRAARPGWLSRPQHQRLSLARGSPPALGGERDRGAHPVRGSRDRCRGDLEPVQNAGGCFVPPEGYFQRVREICDRNDVLMISDEVICAWGGLAITSAATASTTCQTSSPWPRR